MENNGIRDEEKKWNFKGNEKLNGSAVSVRGVFNMLMESIKSNEDHHDNRHVVPMCRVDPTENPLFRTTPVAPQAVSAAALSFHFNHYSSTAGLPQATRAVAEYLSKDLPFKLSPDDVLFTVGATQAIDIILPVLARPGANILLPSPGYPQYESRAAFCRLEVRHFNLLPDKGWEVNLDSVETLADENTVAMVLISPSNPCGNVFTYQHLKEVAETARKLGIFVISDEVYAHIAFGNNPFVPMGVFSSIVPVITIGSLSKRWFVPGWRLGWIATCDPHGIFHKTGIITNIRNYLDITTSSQTFMQAAIPEILERTKDDFYAKNLDIMREAANIFYERCKEIPCLTCPHKPEGAMAVMVKINLSQVEGIVDDLDFCVKLAKEEKVLLLPGVTVGLKNWLRISYAVDRSAVEEGLSRIKAFGLRHAKRPKISQFQNSNFNNESSAYGFFFHTAKGTMLSSSHNRRRFSTTAAGGGFRFAPPNVQDPTRIGGRGGGVAGARWSAAEMQGGQRGTGGGSIPQEGGSEAEEALRS